MNKLLYLLLGTIAFLVFLVVMAPASSVLRIADDEFRQQLPELRLAGISGSIWEGSGTVQYRQFPAVAVNWKLSPLPLLSRAVASSASFTAEGLDAEIQSYVSTDQSAASTISYATALISGDYINQVTLNYGLDLSGEFKLTNARATIRGQWLSDLDGILNWSGGIVHIETPQQLHTVKLPPMVGNLTLDGDNVLLNITADTDEMIRISIKPDGWAEVAVNYAFMDLADLPLPGGTADSDPAILIEEKIF
jgi:hypothetical protein